MSKPIHVEFESCPETLDGGFFVDGVRMSTAKAVGAEIEGGEHDGFHIFTCRDRAQEFCWKHGYTFDFDGVPG